MFKIKKISVLILTLLMVGVLVFAGCSTGEGTDVKAGVDNMLKITAELDTQLQAGNEDKVKEIGPELEESWEKFEDSVKDKYPDLYEKVEDALDPTIAGTEASPLDKDTVKSFNDQLTQALKELANQLK